MLVNKYAFDLITRYEVSDPDSPPLKSYWDTLGKVWTIGYGSTGTDITENTQWTIDQCKSRLAYDMQRFENLVRHAVHVALSDQALGALISLEYNTGPPDSSTLYTLINKKMFLAAADEFPKWDHAQQKEILGLKIRRYDEALTFLRGLR